MFQAAGRLLGGFVPALGSPSSNNMSNSTNNGELVRSYGKVEIRRANIVNIRVDAVVNAANSRLGGGAGVNGAIQSAAGPELLKYTRRQFPNGCKTGWAEITGSYNMNNCEWIIHAVGPDYRQRTQAPGRNMDAELSQCYTRSLTLAVQNGARSIAFPTISTGIFQFPTARAAELALAAVRNFLRTQMGQELDRVVFLMFGSGSVDEAAYLQKFGDFFGPGAGDGNNDGNGGADDNDNDDDDDDDDIPPPPPPRPVQGRGNGVGTRGNGRGVANPAPRPQGIGPNTYTTSPGIGRMPPATVPTHIQAARGNGTPSRGSGGRAGVDISGVPITIPAHISAARDMVDTPQIQGGRGRASGTTVTAPPPTPPSPGTSRGGALPRASIRNRGARGGRGRATPLPTIPEPPAPPFDANQGARGGRGRATAPTLPTEPEAPTGPVNPSRRARGGRGNGAARPIPPAAPTVQEPTEQEPTTTPRRGRGRPRGSTATPTAARPKPPVRGVKPVTKAGLKDQTEPAQPEPEPEPEPEDTEPEKPKRGRKRKATEEAEGSGRPAPAPPRPRGLEINMIDVEPAAPGRVVGGRTLRARKPKKK